MFDKLSPETYRLVEAKAGTRVATSLFWVFLVAAFSAGFGVIGVAVTWLALNVALPVVNAAANRLPVSQVSGVVLSVAAALLALAVVVAQTRKFVRKLGSSVVSMVDDRVGELARVMSSVITQVDHLQREAASTTSVNEALRTLHSEIPTPFPYNGEDMENFNQRALLRLLKSPSASSVGQAPNRAGV